MIADMDKKSYQLISIKKKFFHRIFHRSLVKRLIRDLKKDITECKYMNNNNLSNQIKETLFISLSRAEHIYSKFKWTHNP